MKRFKVMATVMACVLALTASASVSVMASNNPFAVTEPIKIQWWHALESQYTPFVEETVAAFNKANPNITVEAVYQGSYANVNEKLIAAQAANNLPAVTVCNTPLIAEYGAAGLCEPLEKYVQNDKWDIKDFGEGLLYSSSYEGKQISLPFLISTQILFYNKDMAKADGITMPTKWSEMDAWLKKATKGERKATAVPGWDQWYFETFYLNAGVKIINEDTNKTDLGDKAAMEVAAQFKDWQGQGLLDWCYGTDASTNMRQAFIDGKYFSVMHTTSLYDTYVDRCKFEVGMWYYPGNKTRNSEVGGSLILIPAKNTQKVKNAAWQFIKYVTGKDVNMKWAEKTGYMPTRKSVFSSAEGKAFLEKKPAFKAVFDNLDNIYPRIQHPGYSNLSRIWRDAMAKSIIEKTDLDKEMATAAKLINEALADAK